MFPFNKTFFAKQPATKDRNKAIERSPAIITNVLHYLYSMYCPFVCITEEEKKGVSSTKPAPSSTTTSPDINTSPPPPPPPIKKPNKMVGYSSTT